MRHLGSRNACKSAFPGAWTARLRSRNCAQIPGVRTMSDADGGRPSDQAASLSSQSPSGFRASAGLQATSATTGLAERFPAHIEGGRLAPLLHRTSSDAGARYALTDAWDSSRPGAPMADTRAESGRVASCLPCLASLGRAGSRCALGDKRELDEASTGVETRRLTSTPCEAVSLRSSWRDSPIRFVDESSGDPSHLV